MLDVFVGSLCFGRDSVKATANGDFGETLGPFETLGAEESSFPKHEPPKKRPPASSGNLFPNCHEARIPGGVDK